ncbi:MAG: hypothetical protein KJ970_13335 [Candidatus Eisenbacteria bacterium]|uniref:Uncharacterized protein n=1 Tax=Eiseniibacteriota bacterium TaxID=2212470 RepID=A0A948W472_UNCEI|nr:hypothetical protein [Candidatus Eisenbacteria bacterium]MBU1947899.1 hypothetical protein [Candidatus Eisenbacteria bacterium]MBU2691897.1 hypothetical protein [Candidatus Eisenbacteria bacterium]
MDSTDCITVYNPQSKDIQHHRNRLYTIELYLKAASCVKDARARHKFLKERQEVLRRLGYSPGNLATAAAAEPSPTRK